MKNWVKILCSALSACVISACSSMNNYEAAPERYSDLHFDNKSPIQLTVKRVDVKSDFTPSFTRPNVEHLFPLSIEKTAKTWANERLSAVSPSSPAIAEFIIQDASVVESEEKAPQLLQKDRLKYRANLKVMLKVTDRQSTAQTTVEAYRELTMPIDTSIEDKELHWNEMVAKLFKSFDEYMEINTNKYLNMYVKNNNTITSY